MIAIPDRVRRGAKWVGYPLFALFMFVAALYFSLPKDRIQDLLESSASSFLGARVKGDRDRFGLTLLTGPGVSAEAVTATIAPVAPGEKPVVYTIDDLTVHFSVIQLIRGFADTTFSGHAAGGAVSGKYRSVPDEAVIAIDLSNVAIGAIPMLSAPSGIPIDGKVGLKLDITAPKNLVAQAGGSVALIVDDATVGDGKAKLAIPGDPYLSQGVTIPKIALGRLAGNLAIDKGKATFHEVRGHSKDADIELEGYVELRDPLTLSVVHAYLKFKPSDALIKREPTIELMNNMLGATAKRSDGFLGFSITGLLSSLMALPSKEPPFGVANVSTAVARTPPPQNPTVTPIRFAEPSPPSANFEVPPAPPPPMPAPPPPSYDPAGPPPSAPGNPMQMAPANSIPPTARYQGGSALRGIIEGGGGPTGPPPAPTTTDESGRGVGENREGANEILVQ